MRKGEITSNISFSHNVFQSYIYLSLVHQNAVLCGYGIILIKALKALMWHLSREQMLVFEYFLLFHNVFKMLLFSRSIKITYTLSSASALNLVQSEISFILLGVNLSSSNAFKLDEPKMERVNPLQHNGAF